GPRTLRRRSLHDRSRLLLRAVPPANRDGALAGRDARDARRALDRCRRVSDPCGRILGALGLGGGAGGGSAIRGAGGRDSRAGARACVRASGGEAGFGVVRAGSTTLGVGCRFRRKAPTWTSAVPGE